MEANNRWSFDNLISDFSVSKRESQRGTRVFCRHEIGTKRDLTAVFKEFAVDHEFARTRSVVKRQFCQEWTASWVWMASSEWMERS